MRRELLASKKKETGLSLDPRTKLALLITIALFVLSGGGGAASKQFAPILAAVPLILLLTEKSWKGSVIYFVLYGGSYILQLWALPHLSGLPNFLVVAICGFFMRFVPGIMMGYITVRTTTVSEFVASMKKLHLPEQIIIPMSVIFRFFPTVVEEYNAIGDAMKMRGIRFGGGKASAMLEYRLVPVIMCSVKIGGVPADPADGLLGKDRGGAECGSHHKGAGIGQKAHEHLPDRLSCAGCFFPAAMCGGFCNSYCHDDYREVGL